MFFNENLKYLRKSRRLSQENLAKELGISRNMIASYESRSIEPKLSLLINIADYFSVSVDNLVVTLLSESEDQGADTKEVESDTSGEPVFRIDLLNAEDVQEFVENSSKIDMVVNGQLAMQQMMGDKSTTSNSEILNILLMMINTNKAMVVVLEHQN